MQNQNQAKELLTETGKEKEILLAKETFQKNGRLSFEEYKKFLYSYYSVNMTE